MNSKCAAIACRSADIVGLASLVSMEMNELVSLDVGTVKGLILMLVIRKRKLSVAACDALLDLSTTLIGRQRLLKFSALERLVPASSILVSLYNEDGSSIACARIAFKEDRHSVSLLHTSITLINTCNIEQLEKIPSKLSEKFLDFMKSLWEKVHNQMLLGNAWMSFQERDLNLSNVTVNNLAESIFSFSINTSEFVIPLPSVLVERKIFDGSEQSFENFMLPHWEPLLLMKHAFNAMDIMKCEEAFKEGYTIALSFGLQLPRLYDPLDREQCFVEENSLAGYRKFLLREGDILYIPRGFPREACTHDGGSSDLARFSLRHIWWEGFAHVALHCWYQTQKQLHRASVEPLSGILDLMPVTLLHKTTFNNIIDHINKASRFLEVFSSVEVAIETNKDPFHRMRWLRLLY
ncbi:hypothetical protein Peur_007521 [Populus x canadensis]